MYLHRLYYIRCLYSRYTHKHTTNFNRFAIEITIEWFAMQTKKKRTIYSVSPLRGNVFVCAGAPLVELSFHVMNICQSWFFTRTEVKKANNKSKLRTDSLIIWVCLFNVDIYYMHRETSHHRLWAERPWSLWNYIAWEKSPLV